MTLILALIAAAATPQPADVRPADATTQQVDVAFGELSNGHNHEAIARMEASELVKSGDPAALINLGTAYARVGLVDKAARSFAAAAASRQRYELQLADGSWVDSREAARLAARVLPTAGAFASR
jgi:Tfp pilus assembly protein PilF